MRSKVPPILVVDDEPNMRVTVSQLLVDENYEVDLAESAEQAIEMLAEAGAQYLMMITDARLGGMSGTQDGSRTRRTLLPLAMKSFDEQALELSYREKIATIARNYLPVGISAPGFAGVFSPKMVSITEKI